MKIGCGCSNKSNHWKVFRKIDVTKLALIAGKIYQLKNLFLVIFHGIRKINLRNSFSEHVFAETQLLKTYNLTEEMICVKIYEIPNK